MKRMIATLLAFIMIISSMSLGVFAVDETAADDKPSPPSPVTDLKAYSAYNSIALEWTPVAGATNYIIYKDGKPLKKIGANSRAYDNNNMMSGIDYTVKDDENHSYSVSAVNDAGESAKSDTVTDSRVRQMYISITFRGNRKLRSHDSAKVRTTFKSGSTVKAHSFRFGQYIFKHKGHTYHVNYYSVRKQKALYTKNLTYSTKEAEYFANTSKVKSSTKYMIWVNLYTQHLYILKGKAGHWRISKISYNGVSDDNWEISSGKAITPTPAGMNHRIRARQARKGAVKWWNYFHSMTSLHGKSGKSGFGAPHSHGCIRNPDKYALMIYKKIPKYSRVTIY